MGNLKKLTGLLLLSILVLSLVTQRLQAKSTHITIIALADIQGRVDKTKNTGGIATIATLVKKIKRSNPCTLFLASGDDLMGRYFDTFKGKAIYTLLSDIGYQFYAPGNHEFDHGPEAFVKALKYAKFKVLCSDLSTKNTPLKGKCSPFYITDLCRLKIGMFSLMSEDLSTISSPGDVKVKLDNIDTAKKMIKLLKSKHVNLIVAITHIGFKKDKDVALKTKGIDVIVGGHSHNYLKRAYKINNTVIVNGGERATKLVRLDLFIENGRIKRVKYKLIPVKPSITPDKATQKLLLTFKRKLPPSVVIGRIVKPWDLRESVLRYSESGFADTLNDLLKKRFGADMVLNNSGLFRSDTIYKKGKLTDTMLHNIYAFDNVAYIIRIEGKYIKPILEHGASRYGRGGWLQVSGVRFTVNLSKQAQAIGISRDGKPFVKIKGERISNITIKGKALNPQKTYTIVTNDYLARGGDGYFWFKYDAIEKHNTYTSYYSLTAQLVRAHGYLNPEKPDGRIKIIAK